MSDERFIASASVDVAAGASRAWGFWTDVSNWDDPPATFALSGPFTAGSIGTTSIPGRPPIVWTIVDAQPGHATIEIAVEGAVLRFTWTFAARDENRTRMSQVVTLAGPASDAAIADLRAGFGPTIEPGMARLADAMAGAALDHPS